MGKKFGSALLRHHHDKVIFLFSFGCGGFFGALAHVLLQLSFHLLNLTSTARHTNPYLLDQHLFSGAPIEDTTWASKV